MRVDVRVSLMVGVRVDVRLRVTNSNVYPNFYQLGLMLAQT